MRQTLAIHRHDLSHFPHPLSTEDLIMGKGGANVSPSRTICRICDLDRLPVWVGYITKSFATGSKGLQIAEATLGNNNVVSSTTEMHNAIEIEIVSLCDKHVIQSVLLSSQVQSNWDRRKRVQ